MNKLNIRELFKISMLTLFDGANEYYITVEYNTSLFGKERKINLNRSHKYQMKYSLEENNLKNRDTEIRDCEYQIK